MLKSTNADISRQKYPGNSTRVFYAVIACSALIALAGCQSISSSSSTDKPDEIRNVVATSVVASTPKPILVSKRSTQSSLVDWTSRMKPLFSQARSLVEQQTGVDLSEVSLNIASDLAITDEVSHETNRLIQNQFNNRAFANHFLNSVMRGQKGTYAALYATRTSEVMVSLPLMQSYQASLSSDKDVQESAMLALLIHIVCTICCLRRSCAICHPEHLRSIKLFTRS